MFLKVEQKWGIDFNAFLQKLEFTFLRGLIQWRSKLASHFVFLSPSHKAVLVEEEGEKDIKANQVNADL